MSQPINSRPINQAANATLDGTGAGTAYLGPAPGKVWRLTIAAVQTNTAVKVPTCIIYMGAAATSNNLIDGTFTGNLDTSDAVTAYDLSNGNYLWAVWSGGDPGSIGTVSIYGFEDTYQ